MKLEKRQQNNINSNWIEKTQLPKGTILDICNGLGPIVGQYPRRVPGKIELEGLEWEFPDLHSFYHQCHQIFLQPTYKLENGVQIKKIFDGGAHSGLASLMWSHLYPGVEIDAFEADQEIFDHLQNNIQRWGLKNVETNNQAVWSHNQGMSFTKTNDDSGFISKPQENEVSVSTRRLRDLIVENKYDLVKLDIEGAEFEVIEDCSEVLEAVPYWIVEIHHFPYLSTSSNPFSLVQKFKDLGFEIGLSDFHNATWIEDEQKVPFSGLPSKHYVVTLYAWKSKV